MLNFIVADQDVWKRVESERGGGTQSRYSHDLLGGKCTWRECAQTRAVIRPRPPARRGERKFNGWMEERRRVGVRREM